MNTLFDIEEIPERETKSNEWYTTTKYIEAARRVMQGIDLDPASCEEADRTVRATRYYTKEQDWSAESMWLNPPYGRANDSNAGYSIGRRLGGGKSIASLFVKRLIDEYEAGRIKQAILLVTSDTDASWFVPLWKYSICFADHRVLFRRPGLEDQGQFFGTCFVYFGPSIAEFVKCFTQFGPVIPAGTAIRRGQPVQQSTLFDTEAQP